MRKFYTVILFIIPLALSAQQHNTLYTNYINQYYEIAIKQQTEHKIPASIILAQGLLESGAGQSKLAQKANNHFGIKCHTEWTGKKIYHDDDKKNECFRKYDKVLDSYEDHSAFLVNRIRYASLFQLDPTDYKGWAHGLKKAGYATDSKYAHKLISIIEEYELHRFDLMAADKTKSKIKEKSNTVTTKEKKTREKNRNSKINDNNSAVVIDVFAVHKVEKNNGIKYVIARPGDTYGSIADEFSIKESKLLSYNDALEERELIAGEKIYIQRKKAKAAQGLNRHTIKEGESFYSISQEYGIRLVNLYKINKFPYDQRAEAGKTIKIRP